MSFFLSFLEVCNSPQFSCDIGAASVPDQCGYWIVKLFCMPQVRLTQSSKWYFLWKHLHFYHLLVQSLFVEFLAFFHLVIRRGGTFLIISYMWFQYKLSPNSKRLIYSSTNYHSIESSIFLKTVYAMLSIVALFFIIAVIILASFAAYIYITIVLAIGLLMIKARKSELACCLFRCSVKDRYSPNELIWSQW